MAYHCLLSMRVRCLIAEGREIVLGSESVKEGSYYHSARRWARGLFGEGDAEGEERMLVDVVRRQWPDPAKPYRRARIQLRHVHQLHPRHAHPSPWIKGADIEPRIQGSDHCPFWIDFNVEIQAAGKTIRVDDVMKHDREPPRVISQYWVEHFWKQKLLSSFFGHGKGSTKQSVGVAAAAADGVDEPPPEAIPEASPKDSDSLKKRKVLHDAGQTTAEAAGGSDYQDDGDHLDADYRFAVELSKQQDPSTSTPLKDISTSSSACSSSAAWSTLLAPLQPPLCTVHREPAQGFTVNKAGPNKGKKFFVCARPVGLCYDKGRVERIRAEVDHKWKCDYFKWASDARKEAGSSKGDVA
ncbi:hypothetical protein FIBSPDRAFT_939198 [Athelia psychrophila]|uniref:GRF-type domain-containing protein n=1 Tax=Athelia psychrophila TaxID=1759441 RepID=A0A165WY13_9AGAM|nr:hypothetical protein FIBSPDRAFT_939198 [Fibularhizoctonia sp. CBS 109695]